jgi:hypothetical protein
VGGRDLADKVGAELLLKSRSHRDQRSHPVGLHILRRSGAGLPGLDEASLREGRFAMVMARKSGRNLGEDVFT